MTTTSGYSYKIIDGIAVLDKQSQARLCQENIQKLIEQGESPEVRKC